MVSRAAHYSAKAKHSQRTFGEVKPKLETVGSDTLWLGQLRESVAGLGWFSVNHEAVAFIAATPEARETALRKAASMGTLDMTAYRENGSFVEYRWQLT